MTERRQPAEWDPHDACWLAWPHLAGEWLEDFESAREQLAILCETIARSERVKLLVASADGSAEVRLAGAAVDFVTAPYGDVWLRDTGPIFVAGGAGLEAARFRFNGWGHKYLFENDDCVSLRIAEAASVPMVHHDFVLEGGAVDVDGAGTCLTTRQCLLNENRNPGRDATALEGELQRALGIEKVVWLSEGLARDHTDGHVDNVARFVAPGVVVCMEASGSDDPNAEVLAQVATELRAATDARGRPLEVQTIPSPGRVTDRHGTVMPASYLNFYIANGAVVVPRFGASWDDEAVERIGALFPDRETVGHAADALLTGGGTFHCITQQQPRVTW